MSGAPQRRRGRAPRLAFAAYTGSGCGWPNATSASARLGANADRGKKNTVSLFLFFSVVCFFLHRPFVGIFRGIFSRMYHGILLFGGAICLFLGSILSGRCARKRRRKRKNDKVRSRSTKDMKKEETLQSASSGLNRLYLQE